MKFYIADAFTGTLFGGNPAGIVMIPEGEDFPSDEIMVRTAAELRYSETAFIRRLAPCEFNIRYFTPAAEVDLCGHATIASFAMMAESGLIPPDCRCINRTRAGNLDIQVEGGRVMMEMAAPRLISTVSDPARLDRLYEIMGGEYDGSVGLPVMLISTGLPDIMLPLADRAALDALEPDMKMLADLSAEYRVTGVHAFTLDAEEGVSTHARNFAPLYEIPEEAATGTSNGALTYYLWLNKKISSGADCKIIQGEKMGRPSVIITHIEEGADGPLIRVGGGAVKLAAGEIDL